MCFTCTCEDELKDNCDCVSALRKTHQQWECVRGFRWLCDCMQHCFCMCVCAGVCESLGVGLSHRWPWRRLRSGHIHAGCRPCRCKARRPPLSPAGYSECGLNPAAGSLWGDTTQLVAHTQTHSQQHTSKAVKQCAVTRWYTFTFQQHFQ